MQDVYITKISKFLPNKPIANEEMEKYIGKIHNKPSLARRIVLGKNKIVRRFYALDENGNTTHSNAQITALAIEALSDGEFKTEDIEMLCCGTTSPDQIIPSHASMVHGLLKTKNIELGSFSGSCCTGMQALKYGFLSVLTGNSKNAVCTGSERISRWITSTNFEKESEKLKQINNDPYIAFDKEFLRWMVSDGGGAALLERQPNNKGLNLRIDWIDICSFASSKETCMYAGGEKLDDGSIKGWAEYSPSEWLNQSIFSVKQDVKLLGENIVKLGSEYLQEVVAKHNFNINTINYFLPHLSSDFFRDKVKESLEEAGFYIPEEKWFTNLSQVGNVGAASVYLMLEELFHSGRLKKGEKILLMVPESARFSYSFSLLTVC